MACKEEERFVGNILAERDEMDLVIAAAVGAVFAEEACGVIEVVAPVRVSGAESYIVGEHRNGRLSRKLLHEIPIGRIGVDKKSRRFGPGNKVRRRSYACHPRKVRILT